MTQAAPIAYAKSPEVVRQPCTICGKVHKKRPWKKRLYGHVVCKKCPNKLVNRRQIAFIIDIAFIQLLSVLIDIAIYALVPMATIQTMPFWIGHSIFMTLLWVAAFSLKDGFDGRSPGKWLTGIQVVDRDTREPIGFGKSFLRNVILNVPIMPIVAAFQMGKGERIGDGWSRTQVIWLKYRHKAPFEPRAHICKGCGYDLTGNTSGMCPECGTPIPDSVTIDPALAVSRNIEHARLVDDGPETTSRDA